MLKLSIISAFFLLLTIQGCCFTVACDEEVPSFNVRLMRNGKNAVFGPDAFIPVDSIRFYKIIDSSLVDLSFATHENDEFLKFYIYDGREYLLQIPGIVSDTFTAMTESIDDKGCCNSIHVFDVTRNGAVICEENCNEEVTEIEI